MQERHKKARNSGFGMPCTGFMLRAFYNRKGDGQGDRCTQEELCDGKPPFALPFGAMGTKNSMDEPRS